MLPCDRIEVIDRFKESGLDALAGLVDGFLDLLVNFRPLRTLDRLCDRTCHFHFFRNLFVGPVNSGDVGKKIEGQFCVVAQKRCDSDSVFRRQPQRVLRRGAGIGHNLHSRARNRRLNRRLDFFHRLQNSS